MATKLSAQLIKRLTNLKVVASTEEEAKEKLNEILVKEGIEGMEDEDVDTLIEMAESFIEEDGASTEDEENDDLAEEATEEEPEEDDEPEAEEEVKPTKKAATKPAVATTKPAAKVIAMPAKKEVAKPAAKAAAVPAKKEVATKPAVAKPAVAKRGTKIDPKNVEADRKHFDSLKKIFPEKEYLYAWLATAGVTIKHKGKNSNRSVILIENCAIKEDGKMTCNLYLLTFTKNSEVLTDKGIDFEPCWTGAPMIKGISMEDALETIKAVTAEITVWVTKIDKKLGENRVKMEENLSKKSTKKPAAKVAEVEEAEEEAEEEPEEEAEEEAVEEVTPPKKAVAKPAAKPVAKTAAKPTPTPAKKTTKK